eukprot:UN01282
MIIGYFNGQLMEFLQCLCIIGISKLLVHIFNRLFNTIPFFSFLLRFIFSIPILSLLTKASSTHLKSLIFFLRWGLIFSPQLYSIQVRCFH